MTDKCHRRQISLIKYRLILGDLSYIPCFATGFGKLLYLSEFMFSHMWKEEGCKADLYAIKGKFYS